jgi:hypothetical protein
MFSADDRSAAVPIGAAESACVVETVWRRSGAEYLSENLLQFPGTGFSRRFQAFTSFPPPPRSSGGHQPKQAVRNVPTWGCSLLGWRRYIPRCEPALGDRHPAREVRKTLRRADGTLLLVVQFLAIQTQTSNSELQSASCRYSLRCPVDTRQTLRCDHRAAVIPVRSPESASDVEWMVHSATSLR